MMNVYLHSRDHRHFSSRRLDEEILFETDYILMNETGSSGSHGSSKNSYWSLLDPNDTEVFILSLTVYLTLFFAMWLCFSFFRIQFPRAYNVRSGWAETLHQQTQADHGGKKFSCRLAKRDFGVFGWMAQLFFIRDEAIFEQCGLDSLCLIKILDLGFKVSMVGVFNMLWLIPVYATAPDTVETSYIRDIAMSASFANVPPGSGRIVATVLACYILFIYAMYLIVEEYDSWFINLRYECLREHNIKNYTVYVNHVPEEYRSNEALEKYIFDKYNLGRDAVLETNVRLYLPLLSEAVQERDSILQALEHAINIRDIKGEYPIHTDKVTGKKVNSIQAYTERLIQLNQEIKARAEALTQQRSKYNNSQSRYFYEQLNEDNNKNEGYYGNYLGGLNPADNRTVSSGEQFLSTNNSSNRILSGEPFEGGFVTFSSLNSTQIVKQVNLFHEPNTMKVYDAPDPHEIIWSNVGITHSEIQFGKLLSYAGTATLLIVYTFPILLWTSLSSLQGLSVQFDSIQIFITNNPWSVLFFEQFAPIFAVLVNETLLPILLKLLSMLESPISYSTVRVSLFHKLSIFMIVQTFFISMIAGAVCESYYHILGDFNNKEIDSNNNAVTSSAVLANTITFRSTYFIQIVLIISVVGVGLELLGFTRVVILGNIRQRLEPKQTEGERHQPLLFGILRPLSNPKAFHHPRVWSNIILLMIVLFVYASITPISSFVVAFAFLIMGAAYRYQVVYIYPPYPDTGGQLWFHFIDYVSICMIIAELVIVILLGLKRGILWGVLPMIPLIVFTIIFIAYIKGDLSKRARYLPMNICCDIDEKVDLSGCKNAPKIRYASPFGQRYKRRKGMFFVNDLYIQPELKNGKDPLLPGNLTQDLKSAIVEKMDLGLDDDDTKDTITIRGQPMPQWPEQQSMRDETVTEPEQEQQDRSPEPSPSSASSFGEEEPKQMEMPMPQFLPISEDETLSSGELERIKVIREHEETLRKIQEEQEAHENIIASFHEDDDPADALLFKPRPEQEDPPELPRGGGLSSNVQTTMKLKCACSLMEFFKGVTKTLPIVIDDVERVFALKIKPGYAAGTKIKFPGTADEDALPDVMFTLQQEKHEIFKRRGNDLYMSYSLAMPNGGSEYDDMTSSVDYYKVDIELLDGEKWHTRIPKSSRISGESLTVPGKGMPVYGQPGKRGNLIIQFVAEGNEVDMDASETFGSHLEERLL